MFFWYWNVEDNCGNGGVNDRSSKFCLVCVNLFWIGVGKLEVVFVKYFVDFINYIKLRNELLDVSFSILNYDWYVNMKLLGEFWIVEGLWEFFKDFIIDVGFGFGEYDL